MNIPRSIPTGLLLLATLWPESLNAAGPEENRNSVGAIEVQYSDGKSVTASGFCFQDEEHFVTCLHVVAGANSITVRLGGLLIRADVERIYAGGDLALLKLTRPAGTPPLDLASSPPHGGATVTSLGFALGQSTMRDTTGRLRVVGASKLRDFIPDSRHRQQITQQGFPSLDAPVLDLQMTLTPGMSGAPVLDSDGAVIGICNGGLENGATELTWAIAGNELQLLAASTETDAASYHNQSRTLFAAELMSASGTATFVSGLPFVKIRTRTLRELTEMADDKLGLRQLSQLFAKYSPGKWKFDVYRHLDSGATFVVPKESVLQDDGDHATASLSGGDIEIIVQLLPDTDPQFSSNDFETMVNASHNDVTWTLDPLWSYPAPITYPNGLTVRRKAFRSVEMRQVYQQFGPSMWSRCYYFETFAVAGKDLLSIGAVHTNYPSIATDDDQAIAWGQVLLGIQLSNFSRAN